MPSPVSVMQTAIRQPGSDGTDQVKDALILSWCRANGIEKCQ
jgi:hypothetical protein